jgi:hypothetical protein
MQTIKTKIRNITPPQWFLLAFTIVSLGVVLLNPNVLAFANAGEIESKINDSSAAIQKTVRNVSIGIAIASLAAAGLVNMIPNQRISETAKAWAWRILGSVFLVALASTIVTWLFSIVE